MDPFFRQIKSAHQPVSHDRTQRPRFPFASSLLQVRLSLVLVTLMGFALVSGCTKQPGGVVDPSGIPPFVGLAVASPDTIRMKSLPQSNGNLTVTVIAQAKVIRQAGSAGITGVNVGVIASGGTDPLLSVTLRDDGTSPDSVAGDGVYSSLIQFAIPRSASGVYRLRFVATDNQGFVSNSVETPLFLLRDNHPPVTSNLSMPDSATVPVGGSATILLYIRATDQDGQADINSVFFRSLDSSDPTQKFIMNNDGSAPGSVPGDSTYAITVKVQDTPTVRKTYRFAFQAVDTFGDTSATILHSITIH